MTIFCELVAKEVDLENYITYVFKNLEDDSFGKKYIMCTQFKNWDHRQINIGEQGFLEFKEVIAGKDSWYDKYTDMFIPYNCTNIIFIKFVQKIDNSTQDIII